MKTLKEQFRQILEGGCLSEQEKNHLKGVFKAFVKDRNIIQRTSVQTEEEEELGLGFHLDGITGG